MRRLAEVRVIGLGGIERIVGVAFQDQVVIAIAARWRRSARAPGRPRARPARGVG